MKLYENIIIGNFLYGLGFSLGRTFGTNSPPSVINLLQQTPADKTLGDLLVEYPGVVRLIEFKNKSSSKTKEKSKIEILDKAIGGQKELRKVSHDIHWYIETSPKRKECINRIVPYLHAFNSIESRYTLESYINEITKSVIGEKTDFDSSLVKSYLYLVAQSFDEGNVGTGGLIFSVNSTGIRYVQYTDITQLNLQCKELVNQLREEQQSIMTKQVKNEKSLSSTRERRLGRGIS